MVLIVIDAELPHESERRLKFCPRMLRHGRSGGRTSADDLQERISVKIFMLSSLEDCATNVQPAKRPHPRIPVSRHLRLPERINKLPSHGTEI